MTAAKRKMASETPLDPRALGPSTERLLRTLRSNVIGQVDAVEDLVQCFVRWQAGLAPLNRPIGTFLFVGPTGVGKTHLAQAFTRAIGHPADSMLRIDCGEFALQHEVAKIIGAPPGYLGHRETTPIITQKALTAQHTVEAPLSIVLFDEIEKGHGSMSDLILGILDAARLRLGDNQTVDFANTIILMTANLGAKEIADALTPAWGLGRVQSPSAGELRGQIAGIGSRAARRAFKPEFFNRIDKTITFHSLSEAELSEILALELSALAKKLDMASRPIEVHLSPEARDFILKDGFDPRYNARHLKRSISQNLETPLANLLVSGQLKPRDHVLVRLGTERQLEFLEL